jgi:hypothetical protein
LEDEIQDFVLIKKTRYILMEKPLVENKRLLEKPYIRWLKTRLRLLEK